MIMTSENPWVDLPDAPPFVAPVDVELLEKLAGKLTGPCELRLDLRPQPWTGSIHKAEVLLLALNPGHSDRDYEELRNPDYADQWRRALSFDTRTPFYLLDPAFAGYGGDLWWRRRLRDLIDVAGVDAVAQKVMCIEHFPYKSVAYRPLGVTLPSQEYSFNLVREAVRRRKQIVLMRSERIWLHSVAELTGYPYIRLSNNQNPYLSRSQMAADQFDALCAAIRGPASTSAEPLNRQ